VPEQDRKHDPDDDEDAAQADSAYPSVRHGSSQVRVFAYNGLARLTVPLRAVDQRFRTNRIRAGRFCVGLEMVGLWRLLGFRRLVALLLLRKAWQLLLRRRRSRSGSSFAGVGAR
jgi:hypothetical protein